MLNTDLAIAEVGSLNFRNGDAGLFVGSADAQTNSCNLRTITKRMKLKRKLTGKEQRQLLSWCRKSAETEQNVAVAKRAGSSYVANTGNTAIICTANNCVCWQGNHWNGCNDITVCATELKCTWHICTCTPH